MPGIEIPSAAFKAMPADLIAFGTVAVVFGVVNSGLQPIVKALSIPVNLLSMGLFGIVVNIGPLLLAAYVSNEVGGSIKVGDYPPEHPDPGHPGRGGPRAPSSSGSSRRSSVSSCPTDRGSRGRHLAATAGSRRNRRASGSDPRASDCGPRRARFGTPLYVTDGAALDAAAEAFRAAFPDPWLRAYSLKANDLPALVARLARHGFGANVVSRGEWALARRAGAAE